MEIRHILTVFSCTQFKSACISAELNIIYFTQSAPCERFSWAIFLGYIFISGQNSAPWHFLDTVFVNSGPKFKACCTCPGLTVYAGPAWDCLTSCCLVPSATEGLETNSEFWDFSKISGWKKKTCPGTPKLRSPILFVVFLPYPWGVNFLFGRMLSGMGIMTVPVFEVMSHEHFWV